MTQGYRAVLNVFDIGDTRFKIDQDKSNKMRDYLWRDYSNAQINPVVKTGLGNKS